MGLPRKVSGRGPTKRIQIRVSVEDKLPGKRFSDWQRGSMQIRFCAAFPVYEIFTVACLSRRLLPFLMQ
jgi:hypothetical protein